MRLREAKQKDSNRKSGHCPCVHFFVATKSVVADVGGAEGLLYKHKAVAILLIDYLLYCDFVSCIGFCYQ